MADKSIKNERWAIVEKFKTEHGMKVRELAKFMGVSTKTIYNLAESPEKITIEQARRMRLDDHDLRQLIYGKETG